MCSKWFQFTAGVLLLAAAAGCTANHYRKSADKAAYEVLRSKSPLVQNMDPGFTIEQSKPAELEGLSVSTNVELFLGADGPREQGAKVLNLETALALGVKSSRAYQSRKEQLYLSALALTLARHEFTPLFSASGNVAYQVETERAVTIGVDQLTGQPKPIYSDSLVEQHSVVGGGNVGASWLIRDIGRITTAFTIDAVRFVSGDARLVTSSQLGATFTRPLLRNANFKQELEALTQAERQVVYDIRTFVRYRKDFSVQIATAYYGVLGNRDAVRNSFLNLQSSRKNAERSAALAQEGRITQSDLGRLEQQALSAESAWISAIRNYKQSLDNFKIQLGLDPDANLVLDDRELEALQIRHPSLQVEDSIEVALAARLDFLNVKDELADSERKVKVSASFLKPRADLQTGVTINNNPTERGWSLPDPSRYRWNAGLGLDPGLDRMAERNAYREALLRRNQAARAVEQTQADIQLQVRDSWRTLDQAKRSFEISEIGVRLAERRVEEQNLLAELGRAKAQDQVDAQNDLISSKNQRTQALVTHTIARLQFWDNLGILFIKENGQWEEIEDAKR